jgi:hypothetical protein
VWGPRNDDACRESRHAYRHEHGSKRQGGARYGKKIGPCRHGECRECGGQDRRQGRRRPDDDGEQGQRGRYREANKDARHRNDHRKTKPRRGAVEAR